MHAIEGRKLYNEYDVFIEAEQNLIVEETKRACVHFLLLCLKRELRLAVILGEIFDVKSTEGAKILGLTPSAYRQRLSRGEKQLLDFLVKQCGLVDPKNPCHCETLATYHVKNKHIDPNNLFFATHPCRPGRDSHAENLLKELDQMAKAAMLIRNHPDYAAPEVFVETITGYGLLRTVLAICLLH
ncbi:MAG: hypothetical protein CSYNP_01277 [Syntrophus sp. SKADARSKE-3]|nr:hypothetical protein [Syntrophus sp. SKADARSKE-3]